jgi:DNA-nicking Smr family endonuclease
MPRRLTEADRLAWAGYALHVRALNPGAAPPMPTPSPEPTAVPAPVATARPPPAIPRRPAPPVQVGDAPAGLDRATWARFRSGKLAPARTLDLHGRTAQRAHEALHAFLRAAHAEGLRCVEIVTGRGHGEGGVLRRELPQWLNGAELRPLVLAASHPHPANPGSVRVLLRRVRERR